MQGNDSMALKWKPIGSALAYTNVGIHKCWHTQMLAYTNVFQIT